MAKLRKGFRVLEAGAGVQMNGVGALEIAESRSFIAGVVDGLRYRILCRSHLLTSLLTTIPGKLVLRENRRARREMQKMPRMAMLRAQSMIKTTTCYDKIPHIALFCFFSSAFIVRNSGSFRACISSGLWSLSVHRNHVRVMAARNHLPVPPLFLLCHHPLLPVALAPRRITIPS